MSRAVIAAFALLLASACGDRTGREGIITEATCGGYSTMYCRARLDDGSVVNIRGLRLVGERVCEWRDDGVPWWDGCGEHGR